MQRNINLKQLNKLYFMQLKQLSTTDIRSNSMCVQQYKILTRNKSRKLRSFQNSR